MNPPPYPLRRVSAGSASYLENWVAMIDKVESIRQALLDWWSIFEWAVYEYRRNTPPSLLILEEREIKAAFGVVETLIRAHDEFMEMRVRQPQPFFRIVNTSREAYTREVSRAFFDLATTIFTPNTSSGLRIFSIIDPERDSSAILYTYFSAPLLAECHLNHDMKEIVRSEASTIAGALTTAYGEARTLWSIISPELELYIDSPPVPLMPSFSDPDPTNATVFSAISNTLRIPSNATFSYTSSHVPTISLRSGSHFDRATSQGLTVEWEGVTLQTREELAGSWAEIGRRLTELTAMLHT